MITEVSQLWVNIAHLTAAGEHERRVEVGEVDRDDPVISLSPVGALELGRRLVRLAKAAHR